MHSQPTYELILNQENSCNIEFSVSKEFPSVRKVRFADFSILKKIPGNKKKRFFRCLGYSFFLENSYNEKI